LPLHAHVYDMVSINTPQENVILRGVGLGIVNRLSAPS
jgi:hypothetical protein